MAKYWRGYFIANDNYTTFLDENGNHVKIEDLKINQCISGLCLIKETDPIKHITTHNVMLLHSFVVDIETVNLKITQHYDLIDLFEEKPTSRILISSLLYDNDIQYKLLSMSNENMFEVEVVHKMIGGNNVKDRITLLQNLTYTTLLSGYLTYINIPASAIQTHIGKDSKFYKVSFETIIPGNDNIQYVDYFVAICNGEKCLMVGCS